MMRRLAVGSGSRRVYLAPIIQAPPGATVITSVRGMQLPCGEKLRASFIFPGGEFTPSGSAGKVSAIESGSRCESGWGDDEGAVCAELVVSFGVGGGGVGGGVACAVLAVMECP